jgi:hypothetical protein
MSASALKRGLGLLHYAAKSSGICNRKIRQYFSVKRNVGFLQTMYKKVVREPVKAATCVDSSYPEAAEISLARSPVSICVTERFFYGIFCLLKGSAAATDIALCHLEYLFSPCPAGNAASYSGHVSLLARVKPMTT